MEQVRWQVDAAQLEGVTPHRARQMLVDCFVAAQGETLARTAGGHQAADEGEVRALAEGAIRHAFTDLGYDYEQPAAISLWTVMDYLAGQSKSWGTPPDIIMHHFREMSKVVQCVEP